MPFVVNTKRQSVILDLLIGTPVVLLGASNVVNRDVIGAERSKVINSLYVFDFIRAAYRILRTRIIFLS